MVVEGAAEVDLLAVAADQAASSRFGSSSKTDAADAKSYDPYDMSCPSPVEQDADPDLNSSQNKAVTPSSASTFLVSDILTEPEESAAAVAAEVDRQYMSSAALSSAPNSSFAMAAVPPPPAPPPHSVGHHSTSSSSYMHSAMSQFNPSSFSSQYCQSDLGYHDMRGSAAAWYAASPASDPRLAASEYCKFKSLLMLNSIMFCCKSFGRILIQILLVIFNL